MAIKGLFSTSSGKRRGVRPQWYTSFASASNSARTCCCWAGTRGPTTVSFPLTAGAHTLRWRYAKDGSVNTGLDAAFIDDVTVTGCAPS